MVSTAKASRPRVLAPAIPPHTEPALTDSHLEVVVVFTKTVSTLNALRTAAQLASNLRARIRLLVPHVVPYPLPLETPPVRTEFTARKFQTLLESSAVDTEVEVCLCRDKGDGLLQRLKPHSLVVIGKKKTWWSREANALANRLRHNGHQVVVATWK